MRTHKSGTSIAATAACVAIVGLGLGLGAAHAQRVQLDWNQLVTQTLRPIWESVVLPAVVGMTVLAVIARVSVLFGWFDVLSPLSRTTWRRTNEMRLGMVLSILSLSGVELLAIVHPSVGWLWLMASSVVILALTAAHFLARGWASGRGVHVVTVKGSGSDEAGAGQVVALLQQLSAERPRGIEVARGTDVTALSEVGLTAAPSNAVAAAALELVNVLIPRAPWRVRIDAENEDRISVAVTRNGRLVRTATIDRDALGLRVAPVDPAGSRQDSSVEPRSDSADTRYPDLHIMAAAVVLTALVSAYDDIEGLRGATDWRSVGLCVIATSVFQDPHDRLPLLARAIEYDLSNRLAQSAFWHGRGRLSTNRLRLNEYIEWLKEEVQWLEDEEQRIKEQKIRDERVDVEAAEKCAREWAEDWSSYRRRLKMNLAVSALNRSYLKDLGNARHPSDRDDARQAATDLVVDLFEMDPPLHIDDHGRLLQNDAVKDADDAGRLAFSMWPSAAMMYLAMNTPTLGGGESDYLKRAQEEAHRRRDLTMLATYNYACFFATSPKANPHKAVAMLRISDEVPYLNEWRQHDPQLGKFRGTRLYKNSFLGDPAQELSYLSPFSSYRGKLAAAGLERDPAEFRRLAEEKPYLIARLIGADVLVVRRLAGIADLAERLRAKAPGCYLEICAQLLAEGIDKWSSPRPEGLPRKLADALDDRLKDPPSEGDLARWLSCTTPRRLDGARGTLGNRQRRNLPVFF